MSLIRALIEWLRRPRNFKRGGYIKPDKTYECKSAVITIGGTPIQLGNPMPLTKSDIDHAAELARHAVMRCELCRGTFDLYFIVGKDNANPWPRARCGACAERWGWNMWPHELQRDFMERQPSDLCSTLPGMGSYYTPVVDESRKDGHAR